MNKWRVNLIFVLVFILSLGGEYGAVAIHAVAKEPEIEKCIQIAAADTIKIFYCENIHLFVNQFGFMAFEP